MCPEYVFENGVCQITYKGALDFEFFHNNKLIEETYLHAGNVFILDLTEVNFIDSTGIGNLIRLSREIESGGKFLSLTGIGRNLRKVFNLSKIDNVFSVFNTAQEAIRYYT